MSIRRLRKGTPQLMKVIDYFLKILLDVNEIWYANICHIIKNCEKTILHLQIAVTFSNLKLLIN